MSDTSMTRVRKWVQMFYGAENNGLHRIATNFEYYLDNVDALENGAFDHTDLPALSPLGKTVMHTSIHFGFEWATHETELYVVLGPDEKFDQLYGVAENALGHVGAPLDAAPETVEAIHVVAAAGRDPVESLETLHTSESEVSRHIGANLQAFLDNATALEAGTYTPDDFPYLSEEVRWLQMYSALFGRLWECSHPALWVVLDGERFKGLYADPTLAHERAAEAERVQRVNPTDGDLPNSVVIENRGGNPRRQS